MKSKITIFIQTMNLNGGTEVAAVKLVEALNNVGIETEILSLEPYSGELSYVVDLGDDFWRTYHSFHNSIRGKIFSPKSVYLFLKNRLEKYVVENNIRTFINFTFDLFPANPGNVTSVGVIHWSLIGYEQSIQSIIRRKSLLFRYLSKFVFKGEQRLRRKSLETFDYIVALTQTGATEISKINPNVSADRIKVIPNFLKSENKQVAISSQKNKKIIFVSRLSVEKGCYRLLEIWESVIRQNPEWTLDIFGNGQEENGMKHYVSDHKLRNVKFHGFVEDMSNYYPNADIILCTSDSEGFGLVLIEAMHYGVIPVSFDCPVGPKEIISSGGLCVECYDIDRFAQAVSSLCCDLNYRLEIQKKAITRTKYFTEARITDLWKEIL